MPKKINTKPIKYTSREFDTIKQDLVDYAKRYYPNTFRDFNEASFGSLMLDTVAYVGDILSFYLDYQANESFLQTAIEYNNVLRHGRQFGFKFSANPSSHGFLSMYILVPANATGLGPDTDYLPILKKGSTFNSQGGANFVLNEDIDFSNSALEVRVGKVDSSTGVPTHYAIKAIGQVISGRITSETQSIGSFKKFLKLQLSTQDITEIISVVDSDGNEYFETEYMSQDIIFKGVLNQIKDHRDGGAKEILKPFTVPRRFTVEREKRNTFLQFGSSTDARVNNDMIADPSSVVLQVHGKNYISDTSFDPTSLISSDKFGISPSNTTLTIVSRVNNSETVNASAGQLNIVSNAIFSFGDPTLLNTSVLQSVQSSLEVENDEPIVGDVTLPTTEELKVRIYDSFSSQNRAVTQSDYQSMIYRMPPKFGAIKRTAVLRDEDSFKRNLNVYVISEDSDGYLSKTNDSIKSNLKTWLQSNKMVNDTIDILDAKVANFGVNFRVIADLESPKFDVLARAETQLKEYFSRKMDIGEPIFLTDIYSELKKVDGLIDVVSVKIIKKVGGLYSDVNFDLEGGQSPDGRYIEIPKNVILELKYPDSDITGVIV